MRNKALQLVLSLVLLASFLGSSQAATFDLETTSNKVDWISLMGGVPRYRGEKLLLNPVDSADRLESGADLFLRVVPLSGIGWLSLQTEKDASGSSVDVSADIMMQNSWLVRETTQVGMLSPAEQPIAYLGYPWLRFNSGAYSFQVKSLSGLLPSAGRFNIIRLENSPAVDVRYSFANADNALALDKLQGGLQMSNQTVIYRGLLESGKKIRIALANVGYRNYTLDEPVLGTASRWIGDPILAPYTPSSIDKSLPAGFGSDWVIDPFAGQQTFELTLTDSNNNPLRFVFNWDPTNTFKRGTFNTTLSGQIGVASLSDFATLVSKDFGRSVNYVTPTLGSGTVFTPLLMPDSWSRYSTKGVKGISFDVAYTPKSDDTGTRMGVGLMGLELSFQISATDLDLSGTVSGDVVQKKVNDAVKSGNSYADAVLDVLRPQKFPAGSTAVDLVGSVKKAGYSLSDFFQVTDNSNGGRFNTTITFRVLLADISGTPVQLGQGYFLIRDGKEDGVFSDPILITTDATSGSIVNPPIESASSSSSGCNALASPLFALTLCLPLLIMRNRK